MNQNIIIPLRMTTVPIELFNQDLSKLPLLHRHLLRKREELDNLQVQSPYKQKPLRQPEAVLDNKGDSEQKDNRIRQQLMEKVQQCNRDY